MKLSKSGDLSHIKVEYLFLDAEEPVFPGSIGIRCWYHRMSNFRGKVPQEMWPEIKAELEAIRDAANYKQGVRLAHLQGNWDLTRL